MLIRTTPLRCSRPQSSATTSLLKGPRMLIASLVVGLVALVGIAVRQRSSHRPPSSSGARWFSGSMFVGNILALTSITVGSGVTVNGRSLARNGAVTLDNDVFTSVSCDLAPADSTTTTTPADATATTTPGDTTATTAAITTETTTPTSLPFTGQSSMAMFIFAMTALTLGVGALHFSHRSATQPE